MAPYFVGVNVKSYLENLFYIAVGGMIAAAILLPIIAAVVE